jgi:glycosyltransferase involved in cell wall biosynthesis
MTDPLVSINMITYNHAPYIARAIGSVLCQKTSFQFELVIGEDCSNDGTRDIVFDFQKKYPDIIRVITSDKNVGMKENWYRVTMACRGNYIAYCEGDDYWHRDDKLQMQVDYLGSHPRCGLVCSDYDRFVINENKRICNYRKKSQQIIARFPLIDDILTGKAGILTCTVMARRQLIEQVIEADPYLHRNGYFQMGDTQLWAELSLIAQIYYMDESLATHLVLEESATQSKDIRKTLAFWISNSEMCLYLCSKHNLPEHIKQAHEEIWRRKSLQLAFVENRFDLAYQVRQKYTSLSFKDKFWYWGTKYPILRPLVIFVRRAVGNPL